MPPIDQIISVVISTQGQTPSRRNFGLPMVMAFHGQGGPRVQTFTSLQGAESAGFTAANEPDLNRLLTRIFQQSPRVSSVKVGRRQNGTLTQIIRLIPLVIIEGHVYNFSIDGTEVSVTVAAAPTLPSVLAQIEAAITAASIARIASTDDTSTTHIDITATTGSILSYEFLCTDFTYSDESADPGIATDLAEIVDIDPVFYGILLDSNSTAEITSAAAWVETTEYLLGVDSSDSDIFGSGSGDIGSTLNGLNYRRTFTELAKESSNAYYAAAHMSLMFTFDPGAATWAYKTLRGVTSYFLNDTQFGFVTAKAVNNYTEVAGIDITRDGVVANGEYIDIIRLADWLKARIQERLFALLVANPALPYTDSSVAQVVGEVEAQLQEGIRIGGVAADPEPVVTAPRVAEVADSDRANRLLPDIEFTATITGAIHRVEVRGTLLV